MIRPTIISRSRVTYLSGRDYSTSLYVQQLQNHKSQKKLRTAGKTAAIAGVMALISHDSTTVGRAGHPAVESGSFVAYGQLTRETIIYEPWCVIPTFFAGIRGLLLVLIVGVAGLLCG